MRKGLINKSDICNLSRLPIHLNENPIYKTCLEIIDNPGIPPQDTSLFRHYQDYNPSTLYDLYGAVDKLKDYSYQQSFLPWLHSSPVVQYSDIAFIDRKRDFIYDQVHKIKNLISSVEKYGYKPEDFPDRKNGHVTGYWLKHNSYQKFYVVSGNHRISVCFAIDPDKKTPFIHEEPNHFKDRDLVNRRNDILDIYDTQDIYNWPSVKGGFLLPEEAIALTKIYLEGK